MELMAGIRFLKSFDWKMNMTLSKNSIKGFTDYVEDWDNGGLAEISIGKTDLAFSPSVTGNSVLMFKMGKKLEISLLSNYVGKQYIDNTANDGRKLDAYFVNNLKFDYQIKQNLFKSVKINLLINNVFNEEYESNAWVYSYFYEGKRHKMDGYFPQAGTNFLISVNVDF